MANIADSVRWPCLNVNAIEGFGVDRARAQDSKVIQRREVNTPKDFDSLLWRSLICIRNISDRTDEASSNLRVAARMSSQHLPHACSITGIWFV